MDTAALVVPSASRLACCASENGFQLGTVGPLSVQHTCASSLGRLTWVYQPRKSHRVEPDCLFLSARAQPWPRQVPYSPRPCGPDPGNQSRRTGGNTINAGPQGPRPANDATQSQRRRPPPPPPPQRQHQRKSKKTTTNDDDVATMTKKKTFYSFFGGGFGVGFCLVWK